MLLPPVGLCFAFFVTACSKGLYSALGDSTQRAFLRLFKRSCTSRFMHKGDTHTVVFPRTFSKVWDTIYWSYLLLLPLMLPGAL
jgi:hypothetical protein